MMVWMLLAVALSAWVDYPITRTYFYADDFVHLLAVASENPLRFVLEPFGGHNLVGWRLAFLATFHLFGARAEPYHWSMFLTHLLNVALVFAVVRTLAGSSALACLGASLWGTSPAAARTMGMCYCTYGELLVASLFLLTLHQLSRSVTARPRTAERPRTWYGFALLASVCFGVGLGVAFALPVAVFLLAPGCWRRRGVRAAYLALPLVTLATYFSIRCLYTLLAPMPISEKLHVGLVTRGVDVVPELLLYLVAFGTVATALGPFAAGIHVLHVVHLVVPACFVAGLVLIAWRGDGPARRATLALIGFAVGMYGVIALGRGHMPDILPPPVAATSSRYHYAASLPLTVVLCLIVQYVVRSTPFRSVPPALGLGLAFALGAIGYARSGFAIDEHTVTREYVAATMQNVAAAAARQPPGTTTYVQNTGVPPTILTSHVAFPAPAAVFLVVQQSDEVDGRRVRFIEHDPAVFRRLKLYPNPRLAELLVTPADVAASRSGG